LDSVQREHTVKLEPITPRRVSITLGRILAVQACETTVQHRSD